MNDVPNDTVVISGSGKIALTVDSRSVSMHGKGYFWQGGRRVPLRGSGGDTGTAAYGINDLGVIAGGFTDSGDGAILYFDSMPVVWEGRRVRRLASVPGLGLSDVTAKGINNKGMVVGNAGPATPMESGGMPYDVTHGLIWCLGEILDLGLSSVAALNDSGVVVGQIPAIQGENNEPQGGSHAALWKDGKWRDLGTLLGWTFSSARAINAAGDVVGYSTRGRNQDNYEACLWQNGVIHDLGPGQALGINAHGQIIGRCGGRAVLWWRGGTYDLNDRLRGRAGWCLTVAKGIDDHGQIVGLGTSHGQAHAFLLTPLR